jgi:hypothetical protein
MLMLLLKILGNNGMIETRGIVDFDIANGVPPEVGDDIGY